jgi:hypothetical protein
VYLTGGVVCLRICLLPRRIKDKNRRVVGPRSAANLLEV